MARNVRFIRTTKEKWLNRDSYDPLALYFCEDTQEMCKGDQILTDGIRVVPTKADLPTLPFAADGVIYYIANTKSGYMMSPDRTEWLQTIYAPVEDVTTIPESEIYKTVTTVGAVRDIENAIYSYIDQEIASIEISGSAGKDGKTPYIQDGYWYIDGVSTGVKAEGKDGINGKDGTSGKDGKSAYEVWLDAGHSGSEDEFLQWLKGDNDPFGDVVTSIGFDGIPAGTSLKGKTVKDVLSMLLGVQEPLQSVIEYIMSNQIPAFSGTEAEGLTEVTYQELDADAAAYTEQCFYTTTDNGEITRAGYQMIFEGNTECIPQIFAIYSEAKIITAYQYHAAMNQWLNMDFDDTYWVETGTETKIIDGKEVEYRTYAYNVDLMGDAINATEYWRFELEVQ
jgi:hypothetical protein